MYLIYVVVYDLVLAFFQLFKKSIFYINSFSSNQFDIPASIQKITEITGQKITYIGRRKRPSLKTGLRLNAIHGNDFKEISDTGSSRKDDS